MVEPRDITARLLDRAKEDRQCAENNKAVFDAFSEQMRRFESREGHNVYAVRMAVDHKNGMERDTRYAADLEEAAAEIQRLRAEVAALTAEAYSLTSLLATARRERAEAMERAAQIAEKEPAPFIDTVWGQCSGAIAAAIRAEASKKGGEG